MQRILIIRTLLPLMLFSNITEAQGENGDIEQLNTKILQLQQQIIEMQNKHDDEIKCVKTTSKRTCQPGW